MPKLKQNQFLLPSGALITEHPILFSTEMVQANLEDRKTQTRRKVNPQPDEIKTFIGKIGNVPCIGDFPSMVACEWAEEAEKIAKSFKFCPHGKPGDLLWVRETWGRPYLPQYLAKCAYLYKADLFSNLAKEALVGEKWKPSIHMPKSASRIWLMIEDIRVERVQDISEENAKAEGIERWVETRMKSQPVHYRVYDHSDPEALYTSCPIDSFQSLWISINGEDSWNSNPWVWVIKFRVLSKIGRPSLEVIEKNYSEILSGSASLRETRKEVSNG